MAFFRRKEPKEPIVPDTKTFVDPEPGRAPYQNVNEHGVPQVGQFPNLPHVEQGIVYDEHDQPPPNMPPELWGKYDNSQTEAYSQEYLNAIPDNVGAGAGNKSADRHPLSVPAHVSRDMREPAGYEFMRAFDARMERYFNGEHFSMASHVRTYEIGGMEPARERARRNTFRIEPESRDDAYTETADPVLTAPSPRYQFNPDLPPDLTSRSRTWRLS